MGIEKGWKEVAEKEWNKGLKEGKEQGLIEGKKEGILQIAKNLLEQNVDIETISLCTGLSLEELKKIK